MKRLYKAVSIALLSVVISTAVACGSVYIPNREERAFNSLLPKLFEALALDDEAAIYQLFSPAVRAQCGDLQEKISLLTDAYGGTTDEYDAENLCIHTTEHVGFPGNWEKGDVFIPVRSGNDYYWFYVDLTYEHYDEAQIGITQLELYTAEEKLLSQETEGPIISRAGLYLHTSATVDCEVRTIDGVPYRFNTVDRSIDVNEVKSFLSSNNSFLDFINRFGRPNAEWIYYVYELPEKDGEPRYLKVCADEGVIFSVTVVDDFKYITTVWEVD